MPNNDNEKWILMAASDDNFISEIFLKGCFSKTAAKAMYKTSNTGTGNGMRGAQGMRGMLYSGECHQTFRSMLPNIPGNVLKHSGECRQTSRSMLPNIPGNVAKYSGECPQTVREIFPNIPGNVAKDFQECPQTFRGMLPNIPWNVVNFCRK